MRTSYGTPAARRQGPVHPQSIASAAEIGCTGIVLSNHGGRQLDGSRSAFDQLAEIVDAVGDRIDVIMDGGVQRGTHVLKALSMGAKAVGLGRSAYGTHSLRRTKVALVYKKTGNLRACQLLLGHP